MSEQRHHDARRIDRALSVAFVVLGRGLELRCVQVLEESADKDCQHSLSDNARELTHRNGGTSNIAGILRAKDSC